MQYRSYYKDLFLRKFVELLQKMLRAYQKTWPVHETSQVSVKEGKTTAA
jgi:hypothetical protein